MPIFPVTYRFILFPPKGGGKGSEVATRPQPYSPEGAIEGTVGSPYLLRWRFVSSHRIL